MATEPEFKHLRDAVEERKFFTTFVPLEDGERGSTDGYVVCASKRTADGRGLTGCSFNILRRGDDWFIEIWTPRTYRVPNGSHVADLCIAFLAMIPSTPYDVPAALRQRYALDEVGGDALQ